MESSLPLLLWAIVAICLLVGLVGTVLPGLPGAPLIFIGMLLAAWIEDFQRIGFIVLSVGALLTVVSLVADFAATALGAKRAGASKLAIIGATVGTIVGIFSFIPGLIIGPFVGAVVGEFIARRDITQAGRAGVSTWLGLLVGTIAKVAIAGAMIGLLLLSLLFSTKDEPTKSLPITTGQTPISEPISTPAPAPPLVP